MCWMGLPPGNILQQLYLRERLNLVKNNGDNFLEIGSGNGYVSSVFLQLGFQGIGIDLNKKACENNSYVNKQYITKKKYRVINGDFLTTNIDEQFDIIISCMVIEHLQNEVLDNFIKKSLSLLKEDGVLILQVPANMKFWNIEDEIAGHVKRYEETDIKKLSEDYNLTIHHLAALNYPISNWLFKFSNYLVEKNEKDKLNLSQQERTIYTGHREVVMKTKFPKIFNLILNPIVLYPFHVLQKFYSGKLNDALVFYVEFKKRVL